MSRGRREAEAPMTSLATSAEDARRVLAIMWMIRRFEEAVD